MTFLIYLDKECRVKREIADHDQKVIYPICARKGCCFSDADGLCSTEVALDTSGNERAVRFSRLSNLIYNGTHDSQSYEFMNYCWFSFTFQTNFMNECVLQCVCNF